MHGTAVRFYEDMRSGVAGYEYEDGTTAVKLSGTSKLGLVVSELDGEATGYFDVVAYDASANRNKCKLHEKCHFHVFTAAEKDCFAKGEGEKAGAELKRWLTTHNKKRSIASK